MAGTTKYLSLEDVIVRYIRFDQHHNRKVVRLSDAKWQPLEDDTYIGGNVFPKGTEIKVFETANFGWVVLHPTARTIGGAIPARRIYKY